MRAHALHHHPAASCPRARLVAMHGGGPHRRHRRGGQPYGGPRGFGFGPGFGPGGPGGRKAGRGDIRAAILALLAESPMHGYQVIREIAERSEGAWSPSPGSVYPTLQQLADEGLVRSTDTDGRRVFELTEAGQAEAAARTGSLPWEQAAEQADDDLVSLRDLVFQVAGATRQVAAAGTQRQIAAAQEILRDTRRRLYRLLADDEDAGTTPEA